MNQRNYQRELDGILENLPRGEKRLFLHSCCACSSYVLEYLRVYFPITVFYYNPNISFAEEYRHRLEEQKHLIACYNQEGGGYPIQVVEGEYMPERFFAMARGLEQCPEGGERCEGCFRLRLEETARQALAAGADYFASTLSISPLKTRRCSTGLGRKWLLHMVCLGCPRILRRKTDTRDRWSCLLSMSCTGRITVAAYFPCRRGDRSGKLN